MDELLDITGMYGYHIVHLSSFKIVPCYIYTIRRRTELPTCVASEEKPPDKKIIEVLDFKNMISGVDWTNLSYWELSIILSPRKYGSAIMVADPQEKKGKNYYEL